MSRRGLYALGALYAMLLGLSTLWGALTDDRLVKVCDYGLANIRRVVPPGEARVALWLCDMRDRLGLPGPPPLCWVRD